MASCVVALWGHVLFGPLIKCQIVQEAATEEDPGSVAVSHATTPSRCANRVAGDGGPSAAEPSITRPRHQLLALVLRWRRSGRVPQRCPVRPVSPPPIAPVRPGPEAPRVCLPTSVCSGTRRPHARPGRDRSAVEIAHTLVLERDVKLPPDAIGALVRRTAVQHLLVVQRQVACLQRAYHHLPGTEEILRDGRRSQAAPVPSQREVTAVELCMSLGSTPWMSSTKHRRGQIDEPRKGCQSHLSCLRSGQVDRRTHLNIDVLQRHECGVERRTARVWRVRVKGLRAGPRLRNQAGNLLKHARLADELCEQRTEHRALTEQFVQRGDAWPTPVKASADGLSVVRRGVSRATGAQQSDDAWRGKGPELEGRGASSQRHQQVAAVRE